MPLDLKQKSVLVYDFGLFIEVAVTLSKAFGKTYYYSPWKNEYPSINPCLKGSGIEGITRVKNFESFIPKVDLFVFPDVGDGALVKYLRDQGHRVWGSGPAESLELDRWKTKQMLKELGLPVQHCELVIGTKALREYLKEHPNVWVKTSIFRGDMETFRSASYEDSESRLDELDHKLGPRKSIFEFIVEDAIDSTDSNPVVEFGYDGYSIDGVNPVRSFCGYEIKSTSLIGCVIEYSKLPGYARRTNEALAPFLKKYRYRNFFSTELRIHEENGNHVAYLIDPCCRAGSPPHEIYLEIFSNWPEILWYGAEGKVVDPEPVSKYGVFLAMRADWADKNWQTVKVSDDVRHLVKLRNFCLINGVYQIIPSAYGRQQIGACIGLGDTPESAIEQCIEVSQQIRPEGMIDIEVESLDEALAVAKDGERYGIKML